MGDNTKMDVRKIAWRGVDWIHLAQGRDQCSSFVNTVMDLRVLQNVGKFMGM
jgi:hypothetical protein